MTLFPEVGFSKEPYAFNINFPKMRAKIPRYSNRVALALYPRPMSVPCLVSLTVNFGDIRQRHLLGGPTLNDQLECVPYINDINSRTSVLLAVFFTMAPVTRSNALLPLSEGRPQMPQVSLIELPISFGQQC